MIDHAHLRTVSEETLENFEAIASAAEKKLGAGGAAGRDVLITGNTFNDPQAKAHQKIASIGSANTVDLPGVGTGR